jgi:hypothetical protein
VPSPLSATQTFETKAAAASPWAEMLTAKENTNTDRQAANGKYADLIVW